MDEASQVGERLTGRGADLWQVSGHVERPAKKIPVIFDVDVVVAGGGITGIIAALAAGRYGAKTLVVEPFNSLGGNMGPGMFAGGSLHLALGHPEAFPNGLGGIPEEYNQRVVDYEDRLVGSDYFRDSRSASYVALKMMAETGVEVLLSTMVVDVLKEGNKVRGVFVENKSGTAAIRSKVVIDCTGTADVADRSGAAVIEQPQNPSMGQFFAVAGCSSDRCTQAFEAKSELSEDDQAWLDLHAPDARIFMPGARKAWESEEFKIVQQVKNFATLEVSPKPPKDGIMPCRTRVNGRYHPGDGLALSTIQQQMEVFIYEFVTFLNRHVPGFEDAYLFVVSPYFQARGGKSIDSLYVISLEDVRRGARWDDLIYTYYDGGHPVEGGCDIPYRMLVPKRIDGLLAAGRSAIRRGPQLRQRYSVQLMGEAAGIAAAIAVKSGVEPRDVDVKQVQEAMLNLGADIAPPNRLKELGLN